MRTPRTAFALVFLFVSLNVFAQKPPIKWGSVSDDNLAMTSYPGDSLADAVVLCDYQNVEYDINAKDKSIAIERHVRIKLLNDVGVERYGDVSIPFYSYKNSSTINGFKALVHKPDGEEIKVGKDNFFSEELSEYWSVEKVVFPQLEPGVIIEYRYTLRNDDVVSPVDFYFQREIPVDYAELRVRMPDWFNYVSLANGMDDVIYKSDEESVKATVSNFSREGTQRNRRSVSNVGTVDVNYKTELYTVEDVPALREEPYITRMEDYYKHLKYQLASVRFPGQGIEPVLNDWQKVAMELLEDSEFGGVYLNPRDGRKLLDESGIDITSLSTSQKATAIYESIRGSLRWNGSYSIKGSNSYNQLAKEGSGTSGDLNLLLLSALRAAGIPASPVLTSIRSEGKTFEIYPFVDQFNHVFIVANVDDQPVFMDVANDYRPMGYPRVNALNYRGWLLNEDQQVWINVVPPASTSTLYSKLDCSSEAILNGTVQGRFSGYHAADHRVSFSSDEDEYLTGKLANVNGDVELSAVEVTDFEKLNESLTISAVAKVFCDKSGDRIYISLPYAAEEFQNPFKSINRTFPVEYTYPENVRYITEVTLPDGFIVEEVPENISMSVEGGGYSVKRMISDRGESIQVTTTIEKERLQYKPEEYKALRDFHDEIIRLLSEQIVLVKKT